MFDDTPSVARHLLAIDNDEHRRTLATMWKGFHDPERLALCAAPTDAVQEFVRFAHSVNEATMREQLAIQEGAQFEVARKWHSTIVAANADAQFAASALSSLVSMPPPQTDTTPDSKMTAGESTTMRRRARPSPLFQARRVVRRSPLTPPQA